MPSMSLNFEPLDEANLSADISRQIRGMLAAGALCSGNKLPSTRTLARELQVSRGTVVTALETLIAEGFLESRTGSGTFVANGCRFERESVPKTKLREFVLNVIKPDTDATFDGALNFQACRPSLEAFPKMAWRRAAADAASRLPSADYGDPQGELELRIAVASYLCRARGLDVNPGQIIVTNGALHAMHLLAGVYLQSGDEVVFEDPGYPLARQTFATSGATIVPVPVDQHGLIVDYLPPHGHSVKCIYVTPSHQFPTGERLSLTRRHQLIRWAQKYNAIIVEDDYDGEFRYDVAPLPPMAAMTSDGSILYCGTFSKTLFPSLRLGFAAGPEALIRAMTQYRALADYQTNSQMQLTLANFINSGQFEKHIYRMRRIYAHKREILGDAIRASNMRGKLTGTDSGLNALVQLDTDLSATNIADRARLSDVCVSSIARYAVSPRVKDSSLILGYAALSEANIIEGVNRISNAVTRAAQ